MATDTKTTISVAEFGDVVSDLAYFLDYESGTGTADDKWTMGAWVEKGVRGFSFALVMCDVERWNRIEKLLARRGFKVNQAGWVGFSCEPKLWREGYKVIGHVTEVN